jgi:spore germination protein KA
LHQIVIAPLLKSKANVLQTAEVIEKSDLSNIISSIAEGNTILYFHVEELYLSIKTFSAPTAAISDTDTEY